MKFRFLTLLFMQGVIAALCQPVEGMSLAPTRSRTGTIVGQVRVEGHVRRSEPLTVYKNRHFCGTSVKDESILVGDDGAVENVVVIVGGVDEVIEKLSHTIVLDNKDCKFSPHVQAVSVGSEILLHNSDPILHDVHARVNSETLFNVGLPSWRQVKKRLTVPGIITIGCEVLHTWMSAFIVVTSSRYFAVTDSTGQFTLGGVPAGVYELEFWHEKLGRMSRKVVVQADQSAMVEVVFTSPGTDRGAEINH